MNNKLQKLNNTENDVFGRLKRDDGESGEYWSARELQGVLGYTRWENFCQAILRAKKSFDTSFMVSSNNINDHFRKVRKMVGLRHAKELLEQLIREDKGNKTDLYFDYILDIG